MTLIQSLILGAIQGLTEFLPISSSGHLIFIPKIFGWGDQGLSFDAVVHLGTLVAVVIYFRKKLWSIVKDFRFQISDFRLRFGGSGKLGWMIIITMIPAGVVGLLFGDWIEINLRAAWIIGVSMIFWGILLGIADYFSRQHLNPSTLKHLNHSALQHLNWRKALFIGCAQAIALIPGTSRSGITMTAGLFSKLDKKTAAEFSFLMSVPIIALAGAVELVKLIKMGFGDLSLLVLAVGFAAAAVSGLIAIWGLMKIIQRWSFMPFVVYRILVGVLILIFLA
ncbi:MAG: undecaprenyl-diphosphate phosphatase [Patescibacteria group bacterium]